MIFLFQLQQWLVLLLLLLQPLSRLLLNGYLLVCLPLCIILPCLCLPMWDFYYRHHVVFLTLMKMTLVDAYTCIYCYVINLYVVMHMCAWLYMHIYSALWQTIYLMCIGYCNYVKAGVLFMGAWYYIILSILRPIMFARRKSVKCRKKVQQHWKRGTKYTMWAWQIPSLVLCERGEYNNRS